MSNITFIIGPTASGKTEVSCLLAQKIGAEIISCDSMLVYKEPAIITAKPSCEMLNKIKHHFIGIISVRDLYNVFDYYSAAFQKITELHKSGTPVLICGGSGLYMKALCDGLFEGPSKNDALRSEFKERSKNEGLNSLYLELKAVDPSSASKISPNDLKRIIRALEVYHETGVPISQNQKQAKGLCGQFTVRIFGLNQRRASLYERINQRVDKMFAEGAVEEVRQLDKLDLSITAERIIGIKEIREFLNGSISEQEAKELVKKNTRNFAKRQNTWFKKDKRIEWIDIDNLTSESIKDEILNSLGRKELK